MDQKLISTYLGDDTEDPIEKIYQSLEVARYYKSDEVGIIHPVNSSIVKIRDNGMVDIFTSGNQGIRIDPISKSINTFANHEKHHIGNLSIWADQNANIKVTKKTSLETTEFLLKTAKAIMDAAEVNIKTARDKVKIGNKSMAQMDKELEDTNKKLDDTIEDLDKTTKDLSNTTKDLGNTKNTVTNNYNALNNQISQIWSQISSLWNAISSINSGGGG